jgi:hypothetical protein
MNALDALRVHALAGIPLGLLAGLVLGVVTQRRDGWGGYASNGGWAARLSHVSLVVLPMLSGFYALGLPGSRLDLLAWGAWLWIPGSLALSVALAVVAARPSARALLPLPALAVAAASVVFAVAGLST